MPEWSPVTRFGGLRCVGREGRCDHAGAPAPEIRWPSCECMGAPCTDTTPSRRGALDFSFLIFFPLCGRLKSLWGALGCACCRVIGSLIGMAVRMAGDAERCRGVSARRLDQGVRLRRRARRQHFRACRTRRSGCDHVVVERRIVLILHRPVPLGRMRWYPRASLSSPLRREPLM